MARKNPKQQTGTARKKSGEGNGLLGELKNANALNHHLIHMMGKTLELQHLTEQAHRKGPRPDLQPKLDKAVNLASGGLADIAAQDMGSARKKLKDLNLAIQIVRESLPDEMLLQVRMRLEDINKVGAAAAPLFGAGFLLLFSDGKLFHVPPVNGQIEFWCKIALAPYAKAGFTQGGFFVRTATGPAHTPTGLNPEPYKVTRGLPDTLDNYDFGAETSGRIAALALCGAGVTQLNDNNDAYSGDDPGSEMIVMCDKSNLEAMTKGFWAAKSEKAIDKGAGFTVAPA